MRWAVVACISIIGFARPARAEPEFPAAIQDAAHIPCAPACTLCHTVSPGTANTATKAFAMSVLKTGKLVPKGHPESLFDVIAKLKENGTDTDSDGLLDTDELAAGADPSSARSDAEICGPTYGCGAHVARATPQGSNQAPWLLSMALALAVLNHLRRRRRFPRASAGRLRVQS